MGNKWPHRAVGIRLDWDVCVRVCLGLCERVGGGGGHRLQEAGGGEAHGV